MSTNADVTVFVQHGAKGLQLGFFPRRDCIRHDVLGTLWIPVHHRFWLARNMR